VEFHSGSLGHLLSVGIGVALDIKLRKGTNRVFVVLGDGELNEGSIWEARLVARSHHLDNLIAVVDRNHFQANMRTEELNPLEPLEEKFEAFGWRTTRTDGHRFDMLEDAFSHLPIEKEHPTVIIADTVRGKGLPSIEQRADRWFVNFTHEEVEMLLRELHGEGVAALASETLMVR
jgi:transketolase